MNITKYFILITFALTTVLTTVVRGAELKPSFYNDLFKEWKIRVDIYSPDVMSKNKEATLVVLSNNVENIEELLLTAAYRYKRLILVCEGSFIITIEAACDFGEVSTIPKNLVSIERANKNDLNFINFQRDGLDVVVIPESYLTIPSDTIVVKDYIKAAVRADLVSADTQEATGMTFYAQKFMREMQSLFVYELFMYIVALTFFVLLFYKILLMLVKTPTQIFKCTFYCNIVANFYNHFQRFSLNSLFFTVGLLLLLGYIPIVLLILSSVGLDINYLFNYYTYTLNPVNYSDFTYDANIFKLFLIFYSYLFFLFTALLMVFPLYTLLNISYRRIFTVIPNASNLKYIYIGILLMVLFLQTLFETQYISDLVFVLLGLFCYLSYIFYFHKIDVSEMFNNKQRFLLTLFSLAIFMIGPVVGHKVVNRVPFYIYKDLIGVSDSIVMLPYRKSHGTDVLFKDFYYESSAIIFAEQYLIYFPNAKEIFNRGISDLSMDTSFFVTMLSRDQLLKQLLLNKDLKKISSSSDVNNFFYLTEVSPDTAIVPRAVSVTSPYYEVLITLDCNAQIYPTKVSLARYHLRGGEVISRDSVDILNFIGCSDLGMTTFRSLVQSNFINTADIYEIKGLQNRDIMSFEILGEPLKTNYLSIQQSHAWFLYHDAGSNDVIVNYLLDSTDGLNVTKGEKNNISLPLNTLKKTGRLSGSFMLWTIGKNSIIKNTYE